jgi:hypothetical protein
MAGVDAKECGMRHHLFTGLAAALIAAGLVMSAPMASAACQYGGLSGV